MMPSGWSSAPDSFTGSVWCEHGRDESLPSLWAPLRARARLSGGAGGGLVLRPSLDQGGRGRNGCVCVMGMCGNDREGGVLVQHGRGGWAAGGTARRALDACTPPHGRRWATGFVRRSCSTGCCLTVRRLFPPSNRHEHSSFPPLTTPPSARHVSSEHSTHTLTLCSMSHLNCSPSPTGNQPWVTTLTKPERVSAYSRSQYVSLPATSYATGHVASRDRHKRLR